MKVRGKEKICIIMPAYKRHNIIRKALEAYHKHTFETSKVIPHLIMVHDSPVTKKERDFYESVCDQFFTNSRNCGISHSLNRAFLRANSDWVIILESDCIVHESWLQKLVAERDKLLSYYNKLAWIGFRVLDEKGKIVFFYRNMNEVGESVNLPIGDDPEQREYNQMKEVDSVSNVCSFIRREAWLEIKGADRFLKRQWVDADIGLRLKQKGWQTIADPNVSFTTIAPHEKSDQDITDHDYFKNKWREINAKKRA